MVVGELEPLEAIFDVPKESTWEGYKFVITVRDKTNINPRERTHYDEFFTAKKRGPIKFSVNIMNMVVKNNNVAEFGNDRQYNYPNNKNVKIMTKIFACCALKISVHTLRIHP